MNNKVILSSSALQNRLFHLLPPLAQQENDFEVVVRYEKNRLSFSDEISLDVESKNDWETEIRLGDLRKLFKLIKRIPDQPLTISFTNSGIEIFYICI